MKPMIPMPIVAIRIRSFGPKFFRLERLPARASSKVLSPLAVVTTAGSADATATDLRNDLRELLPFSWFRIVDSPRCRVLRPSTSEVFAFISPGYEAGMSGESGKFGGSDEATTSAGWGLVGPEDVGEKR